MPIKPWPATLRLFNACGARAQQDILRGLLSPHPVVRAVCAMVVIRIGAPMAPALQEFAASYAHRDNMGWVFDFIYAELGLPRASHTVAVRAS